MISAGEVHLPGRPTDVVGLKSLAITAQRAFSAFRPGGVKVIAGAPVVEKEMTEEDFRDLAAAGVSMLGEIGLGGVKTAPEAKKMVGWARAHGLQSTIHTGGPSIPGSGLIDADVVLEADPDVIGHINGGHTALPLDQVRCLCERCGRAVEIVHNGNELAALHAVRTTIGLGQAERIILGTDSPAGSGVQPLGILRLLAFLSQHRRCSDGAGVLLRHWQHSAGAPPQLRPRRAGTCRRLRHLGPGTAFGRARSS